MAKLFVFAIGGTGSRVIKALTMLMAAGVKIENTDRIVPIIIDPDSANGDLTRSEEILRLYKNIRKKGVDGIDEKNKFFFKVPVSTPDELGEGKLASDHFRYDISEVKDNLFKDYIGYGELDTPNKAITSLLFSKDNLESNMEVGFKGNPNIGSVVLNKFRDSSFFRQFAQSFGENDRVFIISSIFGGTGAAGFPIILKNIRAAQADVPNHMSLRNANVGAVTILPYFKVNDAGRNSSIDSNTFISKTKAALSYYARNICENQSLDALYYIGDQFTDHTVEGADGASFQKNSAHFIELAAALAIVDFMKRPDDEFSHANGKSGNPKYFEYGLKEATGDITFKFLGDHTYDLIAKPLTQYALFDLFYKQYFDEEGEKSALFTKNGNNKLTKSAMDKRFSEDLAKFNRHFSEWLEEMKRSKVSFQPINETVDKKNFLNLVVGVPEKTSFLSRVRGEEAMVQLLNETDKEDGLDALGDSNKKLLATFAKATERVVTKKITL